MGGSGLPEILGSSNFEKKIQVFFFVQFTWYLRYDYKAILGQNELIDFSRNPDPFSDGLTHFYENQLIC